MNIKAINTYNTFVCNMKAQEIESRPCPDCREPTSVVNLGNEDPREICGRFKCSWDGKKIPK